LGDSDQGQELVEKMRATRTLGHNKKRIECYRFQGGYCAGRRTAPFTEQLFDKDGKPVKSFRTPVALAFELFSSALSKDVNYGVDKTTIYHATLDGTSAMDVRDKEYIETSRVRRCLFVADVDGWWPSVKARWASLRKRLPPHLMPNAIVYREPEDGRGGIENPHLIWLLPPGSRVIPGKGTNKNKQKQLHKMIQKGIVQSLAGAWRRPGPPQQRQDEEPASPVVWDGRSCEAPPIPIIGTFRTCCRSRCWSAAG
jgi:hypothetical protein